MSIPIFTAPREQWAFACGMLVCFAMHRLIVPFVRGFSREFRAARARKRSR